MAMREERSRLRTQVYILEKERAAHEAQHQATAAQLRSLNAAVSFLNIKIGMIRVTFKNHFSLTGIQFRGIRRKVPSFSRRG
jgi:uncharacterized coiled-coil DUF342 family protein